MTTICQVLWVAVEVRVPLGESAFCWSAMARFRQSRWVVSFRPALARRSTEAGSLPMMKFSAKTVVQALLMTSKNRALEPKRRATSVISSFHSSW